MTYTVLKPDLSRVGLLANTGSSPNQFWGDKITQGISDQSDSLSSQDLSIDASNKNIDLSGNTKQWTHTLDSLNLSTLDPVGASVDVGYHLFYYNESSNRNYLMTITKVTEDATKHTKSTIGVNTAVYDLNGITLDAKVFDETTGTLKNIITYLFRDVPWNIRLQSANSEAFAMEIKQDETAQSILQTVVTTFGVEVDAFIEPVSGPTTGALIFGDSNAIKRTILVTDELGSDKEIPVLYGRNMTSLSKTTVSDVFGTRFKPLGKDDLTISSVNDGNPYLTDDAANQQHNPIGWANGTYRDLTIKNTAMTDPLALKHWAEKQVPQLNHPRANYEVSAVFSDGISLGDSIIVQDLYAGTPIVVKSRAIKIESSQADPYSITVTIGEFVDIARKSDSLTSVLAIANSAKTIATQAQSSADTAQVTADVAKSSAQVAQSMANTVSSSVASAVNSAVAQAQSMDAELNQSINNSINETMTTVNTSLAALDSEAAVFKSEADSATSSVASSVSALMTTTSASLAAQGSNAVSTANQALANASSVAVSAASANSTANSNATKALSQASSTATSVAAAASIANSNATKAVTSAGTAITNANTALSSAASALSTANTSSLATSSVASDVNGLKASYTSLNSSAGVLTSQTASLAVSASSASAQFDKVSSSTGSLSAETAALKISASSASAEFTKVNSSADSLAADTASLKISASSAALSIGSVQSSAGSLASDAASLKVSASSAALSVSNLTSSAGSLSAQTASLAVSASSFATAVTSMSTENGSQATSISSLKQRADGFDLTVSKVDNLAVGGRNYFLNSSGVSLDKWGNNSNLWTILTGTTRGTVFTSKPTTAWTSGPQNSLYQSGLDKLIGQQVTVSFWAKADKDGAKFHSEPNGGAVSFNPKLTTIWTRYSYTIPSLATSIINFMPVDVGTIYYLDDLKIEMGNVATDWSPAPEDVDAVTGSLAADTSSLKISASSAALDISHVASSAGSLAADTASLKVSASSAALSISSTQSTASSTATQATSLAVSASSAAVEISNVKSSAGSLSAETSSLKLSASSAALSIGNVQSSAGSLATETAALKVSASSASAQFDKVNSSAGSLATQAASLAVSASSAAIGISNVTSSAGSLASKTASLAVSASSFATTITSMSAENGSQATAINQLKQTATSTTSMIGEINSKLNDMGQVNQLSNTEFSPDFSGWYAGNSSTSGKFTATVPLSSDTSWSLSSEKFNGSNALLRTYGSGASSFYSDLIPVGSNTPVSVSMSAKSSSDYTGTVTLAFYLRYYDSNKNYLSQKIWNSNKVTSWSTFTFTDTTPADTAYIVFNILTNGSAGASSYSQPMLVFSSTVGTYVQGNYNNNGRVSVIEQDLDGITETVSKHTTDIDAVTTRVQTAEGSISTATNNITGLQSSQTQTANQLQTEITDRTTGDANTLTQAKSFTTSQIATYDTGIQSQFTQTSDSFIATLSAINQVVDSSLTNGLDMWQSIDNYNRVQTTQRFYKSTNVPFNGVPSFGYNQSALNGDYTSISTQFMTKNGYQSSTLNVSVDVQARTIGTTATDYFIVYLSEWDDTNTRLAFTSVSGTISTSNSSWVNYRKKITLNTNTTKVLLSYQMRGNGNVYIARPYVGVNELPAGAYVEGPATNNTAMLALMSNNYTFGLNSNGQLVSGIMGNEKQVTLAGKAINLDGNTTVSGDFYALGGNFKNLNASEIKTGTLRAELLVGETGYISKVNTGEIINTVDSQLQIGARGTSGMLTLWSSNSDLDSLQKGSMQYTDKTSATEDGLRFKGNAIQATKTTGQANLYLSPYYGGEVRAVLRGTGSDFVDIHGKQIIAGNITLNGYHTIASSDGGTIVFNDSSDNRIPISVKSVTQSSLVSLKENIRNIDTDYALNEVLKSDVKQYNFTGDNINDTHVSPMIDDVDNKLYIPKDWVSSEGDGVDTYTITGYLIQAIKELNNKITELENINGTTTS